MSVCEQASLSLSSCPDIIAHLFQSILIQSTMWEKIKRLSRRWMLRMEFQSLNFLPFINSNKIIFTESSNDGQTWKHSEVQLGSVPRICLTKWITILPSHVHSHVAPFWNTITALSLSASKPFFLQGDLLKASFKACNSSNSSDDILHDHCSQLHTLDRLCGWLHPSFAAVTTPLPPPWVPVVGADTCTGISTLSLFESQHTCAFFISSSVGIQTCLSNSQSHYAV